MKKKGKGRHRKSVKSRNGQKPYSEALSVTLILV